MGISGNNDKGSITGAVALIGLLVLGLVLGGSASYVFWHDSEAADGANGPCRTSKPIEVVADPAIYLLVTEALAAGGADCPAVQVESLDARDVLSRRAHGASLPDLWIADSHVWLTPVFMGPGPGPRIVSRSLATTPVVLVGGPGAPRFPTWSAAESSGQVSVPDPSTSTAGALAIVAPQAEARRVGETFDEARQVLVPFAQTYGDRVSRGLDLEIAPQTLGRHSERVMVATEREVIAARNQVAHLRDVTPPSGAPVLDFPLAVTRSAAAGSRRVARRLLSYLRSPAGETSLEKAGLRPGDARPIPGVAGVRRMLPPPPPRQVATALESWRTLSVPSSILAVVDASGSMDFPARDGTRMEVLVGAADLALSFLPGHARVGLWIFSVDKGGPGRDWRVMEPVRRLDKLEFGRTQRYALRERAKEMPALTGGGTGLYDTALAAYEQALRDYRPHYSNAVVLMTDGENDDPGSIGLDQLVRRLEQLQDPFRPVRVVGIAIGSDADLGALAAIGAATGGTAYLAAEPDDILAVFAKAVLSR